MSSSKASAKNQEEYDNQRLSKIEYINNQFEGIKKKNGNNYKTNMKK